MREDYLADMDSFAGYLPDRLRTRMRMEQLSDKQAEEAIAPGGGCRQTFQCRHRQTTCGRPSPRANQP
jgi:hypothetical protein